MPETPNRTKVHSNNSTGSVDAASLASVVNGASNKTTPVDADRLPLYDSASSFSLKKFTIANLKAIVGGVTPSYTGFTASTISDDAITYVAGKRYRVDADAGVDFDLKVDYTSISSGAFIEVAVYGNGGNRSVDFATTTNNLSDAVTVVSGRTAHFIILNLGGTIHTLLNDIS